VSRVLRPTWHNISFRRRIL